MTEIVINGVSVTNIADYAEMRHLTVAIVTKMVKGDDQNEKIEPAYRIGHTGMYSIAQLDEMYLKRGTKGLTLASMGFLHPAKARELQDLVAETARNEAEVVANLAASERELEAAQEEIQTLKERLELAYVQKNEYYDLLKENDLLHLL